MAWAARGQWIQGGGAGCGGGRQGGPLHTSGEMMVEVAVTTASTVTPLPPRPAPRRWRSAEITSEGPQQLAAVVITAAAAGSWAQHGTGLGDVTVCHRAVPRSAVSPCHDSHLTSDLLRCWAGAGRGPGPDRHDYNLNKIRGRRGGES